MTIRSALLAGLLLAGPVRAQAPASAVQIASYVPDQIVPLTVAPGYATLVELSPDERIENIVVGDASAWQVTPTKRGDQFVVKPLGGATTNLVVTTTGRRYVFLLNAGDGAAAGPFVLRFSYPDGAPTEAAPPPTLNRYKLSGDRSLFPSDMSDDGERTTILWTSGTPLPAIYAVDRRGHEMLINGRMVGSAFVVEGVSPRYVFRRDKDSAVATRRPARPSR